MNYLRGKMYFNVQKRTKFFVKSAHLSAFLTALVLLISAVQANSAGRLDSSFGVGGKITTNFVVEEFDTSSDRATALAIQPDGKLIAVGTQQINSANPDNRFVNFALVRYNIDGSLDSTFGTGGMVFFRNGLSRAGDVVLQPDGKIIVFGSTNDGAAFLLARFDANGTVDTSFGLNGSVSKIIKLYNFTGTVILQNDGKIVITGTVTNNIDILSTDGDFALARYNVNGSLDDGTMNDSTPLDSYGVAGVVTTDFVAGRDSLSDAVLQSDGKIVAAGSADNNANSDTDFALARYNINGSLDTAFGAGGKLTTSFSTASFGDVAAALAIQPDGKIIAAGRSNGTLTFARYNAQGSLDATFGTGGRAVIANTNQAGSIALRPDGKIYAALNINSTNSDFSLVLVNANGSLDTTFGANGRINTDFTGGADNANDILLQPDGKVVLGGFTVAGGDPFNPPDFALARYVVTPSTTAFDFDGDGKSDLSVFRPSNATWYINPSSGANSFNAAQFGLSSDKLAPADYDGDGKSDIAVWRESEGNFYILNSSNNSVRIENFGLTGDKLTVGDWDGDGKADLSTYRDGAQSFFFYRGSLSNPNGNITYLPWGTSGDKPLRGDFDGDGRQDAAVYRASNRVWYIRNSSNGQIAYQTFGLSTDRFVPADYDGDGKTDTAVFRPSNSVWYILQSSNNQVRYETFGLSNDQLAPADYDGDGRANVAVFRNGTWYILQSNGVVQYRQFGLSGDKPVQADLMP